MKQARHKTSCRLQAAPLHADAFKALAHLTRLQVFFLLVRNGGEVAAGEIGQAVDVSGPTLSHHLDLLARAGLVVRRKQERFVYYRVRRETVSDMVRLLTACC